MSVVVLAVSGIALLADASSWEPTAVAGSLISLALMLLFLHPWLLIGIAIDVAIAGSVLSWHVPATLFQD